jgi:hypothetical protein
MGLEWVKYALNRVWDLGPESEKVLVRGYDMRPVFRRAYGALSKKLRTRLKYYRPYIR